MKKVVDGHFFYLIYFVRLSVQEVKKTRGNQNAIRANFYCILFCFNLVIITLFPIQHKTCGKTTNTHTYKIQILFKLLERTFTELDVVRYTSQKAH